MSTQVSRTEPNFWWGVAGGGAVGGVALAAGAVLEELSSKKVRMKSVLSSFALYGPVGLGMFGAASVVTTWYMRSRGTERLNETGPFFGLMAGAVPMQWAIGSVVVFPLSAAKIYSSSEVRRAPNGVNYAISSAYRGIFRGPTIGIMFLISALSCGGIIGGLKFGESLK